MAAKTYDEEHLDNVKSVVKNLFDEIFDDFRKQVLNKKEINKIKKDVNRIVNNAGNLVGEIVDKTQKTGKLFANHFSHSKTQLSLTSEDESKESRIEEITASAEALAVSPADPQEIHGAQFGDTLKPCPCDHFHKLKTEKEMETELRQFADHQDHRTSDSTFLVFMPHGIPERICGTKPIDKDPAILHDDTIFTILNNNDFKNLRDQPKIIITQACRGNNNVLEEESLNKIKSVVKNLFDEIFDDFGKSVLNNEEIRKIKKDMKLIVNNAGNLVGEIIDKTQKTGKLFANHFSHSKTQISLNISNHGERRTNTTGLIICNKKFDSLSSRPGAEVDLLRMQDLLKELGYSVVVKQNLTAQEMETELRQFADHQDHRTSDSTFLVFMSHGILDGICGTKHCDDKPDVLHDDTIFTIFNNHNCKNLRDKPKIIIMQACRGRGDGIFWVTTDRGEAMADTHAYSLQYHGCYGRRDAITRSHIEKDFIAFKSSTPHNVSWILETTGSLFISQLIYFIKEYCWSHHLEEIFRMVQRSFETPTVLTQMPTIERVSMTRYFYLFPGN
ncbi:LOW QUALITY PROTEIN: inactive caspase-12-like [Cavia porcellus]|uniref:LOW QUALITY PROTEIN: inactive caspase-12-like n=1 Tax=Cavia porcellus TaxID=10141 RepID=UPI002FE340A0